MVPTIDMHRGLESAALSKVPCEAMFGTKHYVGDARATKRKHPHLSTWVKGIRTEGSTPDASIGCSAGEERIKYVTSWPPASQRGPTLERNLNQNRPQERRDDSYYVMTNVSTALPDHVNERNLRCGRTSRFVIRGLCRKEDDVFPPNSSVLSLSRDASSTGICPLGNLDGQLYIILPGQVKCSPDSLVDVITRD